MTWQHCFWFIFNVSNCEHFYNLKKRKTLEIKTNPYLIHFLSLKVNLSHFIFLFQYNKPSLQYLTGNIALYLYMKMSILCIRLYFNKVLHLILHYFLQHGLCWLAITCSASLCLFNSEAFPVSKSISFFFISA